MNADSPEKLNQTLKEIDGRSYKTYKKLQETSWDFAPFILKFEHVQGDPFADPTRVSLDFDLQSTGFPAALYESAARRLAVEDFLLRSFHSACDRLLFRSRGSGKSGEIFAQSPSQKILKRSSVLISGDGCQLIHFVGLPADGRRILGEECAEIFSGVLPALWRKALLPPNLDLDQLKKHIETLEDYLALQKELAQSNWAAFVADGSILPRLSGVSDLPLDESAVPFKAPDDFSQTVDLPHRGETPGMAIPQGITLIAGGGFHGKSALLNALQAAVYPHIPGDGRELVAALSSAVKIRAEDGRAARAVDVSGFMKELPLQESTERFSTQSTSGSTSQAVNIVEALEAGSELLLMDEDTCATNFMIRDARMQALIESRLEPITPLVDRIEEINERFQVSFILVLGGCGDYFESAGEVIAMEWFQPRLATRRAKELVESRPTRRIREASKPFPEIKERRLDPAALNFKKGKREIFIRAWGMDTLSLGRSEVDVRYVEQFAEVGQLEACGWILARMKEFLKEAGTSNRQALENVFRQLESEGVESLAPFNTGLLTLPRPQEVLAALNRLR